MLKTPLEGALTGSTVSPFTAWYWHNYPPEIWGRFMRAFDARRGLLMSLEASEDYADKEVNQRRFEMEGL